jgi:hypothetical protein
LARSQDEAAALVAGLGPGFRALTDLGRLDSIGRQCALEIARLLKLCRRHGAGFVIRVIPDPAKVIGLNFRL